MYENLTDEQRDSYADKMPRKKCPFCDGDTQFLKTKKQGMINWVVICMPCGCKRQSHSDKITAVVMWNHRVTEKI